LSPSVDKIRAELFNCRIHNGLHEQEGNLTGIRSELGKGKEQRRVITTKEKNKGRKLKISRTTTQQQ
jgi:hypothetical protein